VVSYETVTRPVVLLVVVLFAVEARAESGWTLSGDARGWAAPALPGVVIGGALGARRDIGGPWHLSAELGFGNATDANVSWQISQNHLLALVGGGMHTSLGAARLSFDVQAGALGIAEDAKRNQFDRLGQAGITDRERTTNALAPFAQVELAAAVELLDQWFFRLSAGPDVTWLDIDGSARLRLGLLAGFGVAHAF
jgi:hypothetical protein